MKKTYVKPYIAVESFQLNAAIAASCSSENKLALGLGMNTCTLSDNKGDYLPSLGYFGLACEAAGGYDVIEVGSNNLNSNDPNSNDLNDTFCYHGPVFNTVFMNS